MRAVKSGAEVEVAVLVDSNCAFPGCDSGWHAGAGIGADGNVEPRRNAAEFRVGGPCIGATSFKVREFDWTRPMVKLENAQEHKEGDGPDIEVYEHAPRAAVSRFSDATLSRPGGGGAQPVPGSPHTTNVERLAHDEVEAAAIVEADAPRVARARPVRGARRTKCIRRRRPEPIRRRGKCRRVNCRA